MDQEMERRWRTGLPPFDGLILHQADLVPLSRLRLVLIDVVEILSRDREAEGLAKVADWHEHDGFVALPERSSWQELRSILVSGDTLFASGTGETYVSTGYFPTDRAFYFRIYIPDEYDLPRDCTEKQGQFDLTCGEAMAERVLNAVEQTSSVRLIKTPAKPYFDRTWRG
jgi:hypothetical protein